MKKFITFLLVIVLPFSAIFLNLASCAKSNSQIVDEVLLKNKIKEDSILLLKATQKIIEVERALAECKTPKPVISSKYKISDCVKAWGRWNGVITSMRMGNSGEVVYTVSILTDNNGFEEGEYYDTELVYGSCN